MLLVAGSLVAATAVLASSGCAAATAEGNPTATPAPGRADNRPTAVKGESTSSYKPSTPSSRSYGTGKHGKGVRGQ